MYAVDDAKLRVKIRLAVDAGARRPLLAKVKNRYKAGIIFIVALAASTAMLLFSHLYWPLNSVAIGITEMTIIVTLYVVAMCLIAVFDL